MSAFPQYWIETGVIGGKSRGGPDRTGPSAVSRKVLSELAPLLAKERLGEVPDSSCNPPESPLGKGGRKGCNLSGNGTSIRFRAEVSD